MKKEILGVQFDDKTKPELYEEIEKLLQDGKQHYIVLPYSEFLVRARKNKDFRKILNNADLCIAEGMGPVIASRILGNPLGGRITGVELVRELGIRNQESRPSLFFFGAKAGVAEEAVQKLVGRDRSIRIVGTLHGENYKNAKRHEEIVKAINGVQPELLFVGLGSPRQEQWIVEHLPRLPSVKIAIGVGGAFDFISGRAKRAPVFLQNIGLEWMWRFVREPRRLSRINVAVIKFPMVIFLAKLESVIQKKNY